MVYQGATGLYHFVINVIPFISNSVLSNLPDYKLIKLQRLQNVVVRCVHLLSRRSGNVVPLTPLILS